MAKVFRIFKALNEKDTDWFTSDAIGRGIIDSIDVQETDGKKLPTSIPSPFAQIDLVRSSFITVNSEFIQHNVDLDSKKDAHQIVSNALDIGEILFNYNTFSSKLSIELWDKSESLKSLLNSSNSNHQHLGKTLELFLSSEDAGSFNFDKLDKIFILKYENQVIGGTSPKTLFFAAAEAFKVKVDIECGNDKMLDEYPLSLHKRDPDYIRYLFSLKNKKGFTENFPEVSDYLDNVLKTINVSDVDFSNELRTIKFSDNFQHLTLPNNSGIKLEVLPGFHLFQSKVKELDYSDFFINTTKNIAKKPLALPTESFTDRLRYTTDTWLSNTVVPTEDKRRLEDRTLPRVNLKYPYLTISDFLEDAIVKLPYKIDVKNYFAIKGFEQFLLPLKPMFFDYFSAEDILKKELVSIKERAGESIEVILKIPIQKGNYITYRKFYKTSTNAINNDSKFGKITDSNFTLGIYPFVSSKDVIIDYSVAVSETNKNHQIKSISLIDSIANKKIEVNIRKRSEEGTLYTKHNLANEFFDVIQVDAFGSKNILIPRMKLYDNTVQKFHFAIDFGTTNTHIEYLHSRGSLPETYKLDNEHFVFARDKSQEDLRGRALTSSQDSEAALTQELMDNSLGANQYEFPFRSVILENRSINYNNPNYLYGDVNIGFDYEKVAIREHLTRRSNLKWMHLDENFNNERVSMFIKQLLQLCKNKVLHNHGDLNNTTITWLYPTSMAYTHRTRFEEIWNEQFKKVFPNSDLKKLRSLPESIAPFYYYQSFEGLMNQTAPTVSIDIGGGTTDITIFEQNKPKLISSFKYAGNSIFGDGYNSNINANGFVKKYYAEFKTKLESNNEIASQELMILNEIFEKYQSSDDLSNFLFSLEDNFNLVSNDVNINYSKKLKNDDDLKIVFILFYSSIIYHVAQIMKAQGLAVPLNILFSGTASKTTKILDSNLSKLTTLFELIFNHVYDTKGTKVEIHTNDSPKVLTAKGALKSTETDLDLEQVIFSYLGDDKLQFNQKNTSYKDIDDSMIKSVEQNVQNFYKIMDSINTEMSFKKSFGVSQKSLEVFKNNRVQSLRDYILTGLEERKKDINDNDARVEETLFFYPFIGLLNKLASEVVA